ncbi:hypothetical protein LXJ15735_36590 [Lacrimispora xylanolytica]
MYCWDGTNIVAEQIDNQKIKTYLRGINLITCEKDNVVYYYIFNEHEDVTQLWSQSGACKDCTNNPIRYLDTTGDTAVEVFKWSWMTGGIVSQADSPVPGPADIVGLVIGVVGTIVAGGILAGEATSNANEKAKAREDSITKATAITISKTEEKNPTIIY